MTKTDSNRRFLLPITEIKEGTRLRKDYGDISELASSIRDHGLLQPIVIDLTGTLIAGGRRLKAMRDILQWTEIPVTYFEVADEATLRILEVEENVRRKEMTWQERVCAIADIHNKHALNAALKSSRWTQRATGELLNMSEADTSYALQLADLIRKNDKEIVNSLRMWDAINLLVKRRADESTKLLAKMTIPTVAETQALLENTELSSTQFFAPPPGASAGSVGTLSDDGEMPGQAPATPRITVPLSRMLLHGNSVDLLKQFPPDSIDHSITDWPYAIDMDNIQQSGGGKDVSTTAAEHNVQENLLLQKAIVPEIYRVLRPNAFFVTWTDISVWQYNYDLLLAAGFKVQSWPLVWFKTHRCQNMAAGYNFTKNFEIAIVARKGNATLLSAQGSSVWAGSNEAEATALGHPFAKPYALWHWIYSAIVQRGQTILDPFAGRGSSTIAALQYGAQPVACEVNKDHHAGLVVNVAEWYRKNLKNVEFI